ncbi:MAG TPA: C4-type zinc ribbon domain-containing protein [Planctomycetota bacterium]|nr:C4-type zinc ribbon domain-containing protein [Planctomycetota bacterium]
MSRLTDALIPLQLFDIEIHRLRTIRNDKPRDLAGQEQKLGRAKENLVAMLDEIKGLKLEVQKREHSIREFDDKVAKLTAQSMGAKKNDEYQVFLKEISGVKADKARVEDGLLDLMFQLDEKAKLEKIREGEVAAAEADHAVAKKKVEAEMKEVDGQLDELGARRREALAGMDRDLLVQYERVLRAKDDGIALAPVLHLEVIEDEGLRKYWGCGGCSVEVNAQMVNELKKGRDLVVCRSCSRLLRWQDEPSAAPKPVQA